MILVAVPDGDPFAVALAEVPDSRLLARGLDTLVAAAHEGPDAVVIVADLPDMTGLELCRRLRQEAGVGPQVPVLLLTAERPTPEQRVAALRAGAWDYLAPPADAAHGEFGRRLEAYVQAKHSIEGGLTEGLLEPLTRLYSRVGLACRARELGALMARAHTGLACIALTLDSPTDDPRTGSIVASAARVSDVVGTLGPSEYAVIAPATSEAGAIRLAERITEMLRAHRRDGHLFVPGETLQYGCDVVGNLRYTPMDAAELLHGAVTAMRTGESHPDAFWMRRPTARVSGRHLRREVTL